MHNTPDLVVDNKKELLKQLKFSDIKSLQLLMGYFASKLYLSILSYKWHKWALNQYKTFDKFILLSDRYIPIQQRILRNGDKEKKLVAIPNPRSKLRNKISVYKKRKQIIYVGRFAEEKAIYRLLLI